MPFLPLGQVVYSVVRGRLAGFVATDPGNLCVLTINDRSDRNAP